MECLYKAIVRHYVVILEKFKYITEANESMFLLLNELETNGERGNVLLVRATQGKESPLNFIKILKSI